MNNENFHFYIKVRTALNIQPKFIHDEHYSVFGDQDSSYNTVAKCFEKDEKIKHDL